MILRPNICLDGFERALKINIANETEKAPKCSSQHRSLDVSEFAYFSTAAWTTTISPTRKVLERRLVDDQREAFHPARPLGLGSAAEVDDLWCARGVWLLSMRLVGRILVMRFALEAPSSLKKVQLRIRSRWDLHFVPEIRSDVDFSSPLSLRRLYDGSPPENASSFACRCIRVSITAQTSEGEEKKTRIGVEVFFLLLSAPSYKIIADRWKYFCFRLTFERFRHLRQGGLEL